MPFKKLNSRFFLATIISTQIVSCSGEPSSSDIDKTIRSKTDAATKELKKIGINDMPKILNIRKVGCAKAQYEPGFICDIESEVEIDKNNVVRGVEKYRFVNSEKGWEVLEKRR